MFQARIVDVATVTDYRGDQIRGKLEALLTVAPYGIKELVRSGVVALGRGSRSITDRAAGA